MCHWVRFAGSGERPRRAERPLDSFFRGGVSIAPSAPECAIGFVLHKWWSAGDSAALACMRVHLEARTPRGSGERLAGFLVMGVGGTGGRSGRDRDHDTGILPVSGVRG